MNNKSIFIICLLLCGLYFYQKNLKNNLIIICLFGLYLVLFHNNNNEHLTTDEAIQNLASLYNSGTLKATNLEISGDLKVAGNSMLNNVSVSKNVTTPDLTTDNIIVNKNLTANNDANIKGILSVTGKSKLASNVELGDNLVMNTGKVIALGDIGLVYELLNRGGGQFKIFRGSDKQLAFSNNIGAPGWYWQTNVNGGGDPVNASFPKNNN